MAQSSACAAHRLGACDHRQMEGLEAASCLADLVPAAEDTFAVADTLAVAAGTGLAAAAEGDTDCDRHAEGEADHMRRTAACLVAGSGRARRCAPAQRPGSAR